MAVNLEDYFQTTFEDKLLVKMPEREDDHLTAATSLLEKRREMAEVEQALQAQKEEFQMKKESLQQRQEELERKEFNLKESLLRFDKFLKENDAKRIRAIKKAEDEIEIKKSKINEIEKLKENISTFVAERDKNREILRKQKIFQIYLDGVLETSDEYHEISDLISRFHTLTNTHGDLMLREKENQTKVEDLKQILIKYTEEKNNEILGFNNQLAGLQTCLDNGQSNAVKWESKWNHIQNTAAKKTLFLGKIKMATDNHYQLVCRYQRTRNDEEELFDSSDQLDYIQEFIQGFTYIINEIRSNQAASASHVSSS